MPKKVNRRILVYRARQAIVDAQHAQPKNFSKTDLSQGFHQLRLSDEDKKKSAITTRYGNFEWTVAAFGMANVPSVFSRVVGECYGSIRKHL